MKSKLFRINNIKDQIKEINKTTKKDNNQMQNEVKRLFKDIQTIKKSLMTKAKFVEKGNTSDDRQFGRKTLKTSFEDFMNLPYERLKLFKK
jgi:Mg2+ and Co2+ transporter CorA